MSLVTVFSEIIQLWVLSMGFNTARDVNGVFFRTPAGVALNVFSYIHWHTLLFMGCPTRPGGALLHGIVLLTRVVHCNCTEF